MNPKRRAPEPNPTGETVGERHVRMLSEVRDRLRAALPASPPPAEVPCQLHGAPWRRCSKCSRGAT